MNTTLGYNDLAPAEREVAHLYAWGMTKKEIAIKRGKSIHTIDMQIRRLFQKTGTRKDTEFASWYFCTRFKISLDFSPIHRAITSIVLLMILGLGAINNSNPFVRVRTGNARTARSARARGRSRRNDLDLDYEYGY